MKNTIVKTYTGNYLKAIKLTEKDFETELHLADYSEYAKSVYISYSYKLTVAAQKKLKDAYGEAIWNVLEGSALTNRFAVNSSSAQYKTFEGSSIGTHRDVSFKGMRKESSKKAKIKEILQTMTETFDVEKHFKSRIEVTNERIEKNITSINRQVLDSAKTSLVWFEPWVKEADERAGNVDLIKEIDELAVVLKAKKQELCEKRNVAFLRVCEEEGWINSDGEKLPVEYVGLWKNMLEKNEGFKISGRHPSLD